MWTSSILFIPFWFLYYRLPDVWIIDIWEFKYEATNSNWHLNINDYDFSWRHLIQLANDHNDSIFCLSLMNFQALKGTCFLFELFTRKILMFNLSSDGNSNLWALPLGLSIFLSILSSRLTFLKMISAMKIGWNQVVFSCFFDLLIFVFGFIEALQFFLKNRFTSQRNFLFQFLIQFKKSIFNLHLHQILHLQNDYLESNWFEFHFKLKWRYFEKIGIRQKLPTQRILLN
jgi:hypothetical protein